MFNVHITPKSKNVKTGPIPVTTSTESSCPSICPLNTANSGGCYANGGPLHLHWKKVTEGERGDGWDTFVSKIAKLPQGQLWRHNQAGDLPHSNEYIDGDMVMSLVDANSGKRGFTYTHHDMGKPHNRKMVERANASGFTVNVSGNNPKHAARLHDEVNAPVVSVVSSDFWDNGNSAEFNGKKFVRCPAEYSEGVSCATCKMCAISERKAIIAFTAHGTQKKKASIIAKG